MRAAALLEAPEVFHMQQVCCARDRDRPRFVHDRELLLSCRPWREPKIGSESARANRAIVDWNGVGTKGESQYYLN
jgi:hypothetical protein